jgi:acetyltransferase-like isoleucine patch superfamily enzyme
MRQSNQPTMHVGPGRRGVARLSRVGLRVAQPTVESYMVLAKPEKDGVGMDRSGNTDSAGRQALRDAYVRTGRVPLATLLRVGLRDAVLPPLWLPLKHLPGAVGMKLRQWVYRASLGHLGKGSLIDLGVEIISPKSVHIGRFTLIDKYCLFEGGNGRIEIGDRCHIAPWVTILGQGGVFIDDYTGVAASAKIFSISEWPGDGKRLCGPMIPDEQRGLRMAPVKLGRDALVGANVVIMPGVTIGEGAVVGANSVVTRDIPPWTIALGAPAKPVANRERVTVEDLPVD